MKKLLLLSAILYLPAPILALPLTWEELWALPQQPAKLTDFRGSGDELEVHGTFQIRYGAGIEDYPAAPSGLVVGGRGVSISMIFDTAPPNQYPHAMNVSGVDNPLFLRFPATVFPGVPFSYHNFVFADEPLSRAFVDWTIDWDGKSGVGNGTWGWQRLPDSGSTGVLLGLAVMGFGLLHRRLLR